MTCVICAASGWPLCLECGSARKSVFGAEPWEGHAYVPPREGHGSWGCEVCNYSEDMHTDAPERKSEVE